MGRAIHCQILAGFLTILPAARERLTASEPVWLDRTSGPFLRTYGAMVYEVAREVELVFGGLGTSGRLGDTWQWDGSTWTLLSSTGPSPRYGHATAYDSARGVVVLFGGYDGVYNGETWEWDGNVWILRATAGPSPRAYHAMAYDSARGVVVVFGGTGTGSCPWGGSIPNGETWEWDGDAWTLRATSGPSARYNHALAYDSARGVAVLFGGASCGKPMPTFGDTWEWNGSAWTRRATSGPARHGSAMAYDSSRGQVVFFGGWDAAGIHGDTWEWNGNGWTLRATGGPSPRSGHAMAYDIARNRTVLLGGGSGDTWEWDGSTWTLRVGPSARRSSGIAYDSARRRVVLFGGIANNGTGTTGLSDTLEWDGIEWTLGATTGPSPRGAHAMAYDNIRDRVVLFGGWNVNGDTWEWDGSGWLMRATVGPSARSFHAMDYDSARGVTVLFGGSIYDGVQYLGDTWEWDGSDWTLRATTGPSPRRAHAMVYDSIRARVVVFGGETAGGVRLGDTWEWDGSAWLMRATIGPSARSFHAMGYDSARGVTVLFGGSDGLSDGETWEWDGSAWLMRATVGPIARTSHSMAYDTSRGRMVLFGGSAVGGGLGDTWEYGSPRLGDFDGDEGVNLADYEDLQPCITGPAFSIYAGCAPGDFDFDGDIDLFDLGRFQFAMSTPAFADSDGDRLANIYETNNGVFTNSQATGTDPNNPDTDGDSINDGDEVLGTVDGLALRFMGANPLRKDIFVEIDWVNSNGTPPERNRPTSDQVERVVEAFRVAPVNNPDGSWGITLHIDIGQAQYGRGNYAGEYPVVDISNSGLDGQFLAIKNAHFAPNRLGYFHYAISCDLFSIDGEPRYEAGGRAELPFPANDFILAVGRFWPGWPGGASTNDPAVGNAIMHELGHNLGLRHGGHENRLYKPNYNSVMNYRYAYPGIDTDGDSIGDGVLDYSRSVLPPLNENLLDETKGVSGLAEGPPIDWNLDGSPTDTAVERNINCEATPAFVTDDCEGPEDDRCDDNLCDILTGSDDWQHLELDGILDADRAAPEVITCRFGTP